jgi:hypothetical protein
MEKDFAVEAKHKRTRLRKHQEDEELGQDEDENFLDLKDAK